ncbi:MAG: PqqD family protein, partial [Clostridia bacterium]|nr:PqqD family protein [Clostridia bacterium]
WKCLEKGMDFDAIVAQLKSEYDAPEDVLRADLTAFIEKLKGYKIVSE